MAIKTYRLDSISLVADDYPAPWIQEVQTVRQRAIRVNPIEHFSTWAYKIEKSLWPALGVSLREYVDKDKSAALRNAQTNCDPEVRKNSLLTIKYMAYAMSSPPVFDFHEGDLFFPKTERLLPVIQVVAKRKLIEVHQIDAQPNGLRCAFQVVDTELAEWLQCGDAPNHARIDPALSYSEVLRFSIKLD